MTSKHRSTPYLHGLSSRGSGAIASSNFGSYTRLARLVGGLSGMQNFWEPERDQAGLSFPFFRKA